MLPLEFLFSRKFSRLMGNLFSGKMIFDHMFYFIACIFALLEQWFSGKPVGVLPLPAQVWFQLFRCLYCLSCSWNTQSNTSQEIYPSLAKNWRLRGSCLKKWPLISFPRALQEINPSLAKKMGSRESLCKTITFDQLSKLDILLPISGVRTKMVMITFS